MKNLLILLSVSFIYSPLFSSENNYAFQSDSLQKGIYLVNSKDSSKRILVDTSKTVKIEVDYGRVDSANVYGTYSGGIKKIDSDSMQMSLCYESAFYLYRKDEFAKHERTNCSCCDRFNRNIPVNNISSIYLPYKRNKIGMAIQNSLATVAIGSFVSAILVAPLVSINYRTGEFNQRRYYRWAGYSLIGFSVGLPLYGLINPNDGNYSVTSNSELRSKYHWRIIVE